MGAAGTLSTAPAVLPSSDPVKAAPRVPCIAPLAGSGTITPDQTADETFIDSPIGWGNRSVVHAAFARTGLQRAVHLETRGDH